jgi:hypothetical protein
MFDDKLRDTPPHRLKHTYTGTEAPAHEAENPGVCGSRKRWPIIRDWGEEHKRLTPDQADLREWAQADQPGAITQVD